MYKCFLPVRLFVCAPHVPCGQGSQKSVFKSWNRAGVREGCKLPSVCWGPTQVPVQEQQVLLPVEPSLQALGYNLKKKMSFNFMSGSTVTSCFSCFSNFCIRRSCHLTRELPLRRLIDCLWLDTEEASGKMLSEFFFFLATRSYRPSSLPTLSRFLVLSMLSPHYY